MVDFKLALRRVQKENGYCKIDPVVMPRQLDGIRESQPVKVTLGVQYREVYAGLDITVMTPVLTVIEGNVTGYEAWDIPHLLAMDILDDPISDRFYVNAGGMGWDSLYLNTGDVQQYIRDFLAQEIKYTQ